MDDLDRRLLQEFQRDFPLSARPYAEMAKKLDTTEADVMDRLARLSETGTVSRVGGVFRPGKVGASTLAAMEVPPERTTEIAAYISSMSQVNHNYEREHAFNLWFVVTGRDRDEVTETLREIEDQTGFAVMDLPLVEPYHLDLGFKLQWNEVDSKKA